MFRRRFRRNRANLYRTRLPSKYKITTIPRLGPICKIVHFCNRKLEINFNYGSAFHDSAFQQIIFTPVWSGPNSFLDAFVDNYGRFCIPRIRLYMSNFDLTIWYGTASSPGARVPIDELKQVNVDLRDKVRFAFLRTMEPVVEQYTSDPLSNAKYKSYRRNLVYKQYIYVKPRKHIKTSLLSEKTLWDCLKLMNVDFQLPNLYMHLDVVSDLGFKDKDFVMNQINFTVSMYIDFVFSDRSPVLIQ